MRSGVPVIVKSTTIHKEERGNSYTLCLIPNPGAKKDHSFRVERQDIPFSPSLGGDFSHKPLKTQFFRTHLIPDAVLQWVRSDRLEKAA